MKKEEDGREGVEQNCFELKQRDKFFNESISRDRNTARYRTRRRDKYSAISQTRGERRRRKILINMGPIHRLISNAHAWILFKRRRRNSEDMFRKWSNNKRSTRIERFSRATYLPTYLPTYCLFLLFMNSRRADNLSGFLFLPRSFITLIKIHKKKETRDTRL